MKVTELIKRLNSDFYTGVPDSQLKPLCNYLINTYGIDKNHHIIAANEGNCVGLAAGYYLSTNKVPVYGRQLLFVLCVEIMDRAVLFVILGDTALSLFSKSAKYYSPLILPSALGLFQILPVCAYGH